MAALWEQGAVCELKKIRGEFGLCDQLLCWLSAGFPEAGRLRPGAAVQVLLVGHKVDVHENLPIGML